jgi:hypothetical protein
MVGHFEMAKGIPANQKRGEEIAMTVKFTVPSKATHSAAEIDKVLINQVLSLVTEAVDAHIHEFKRSRA